MKGNKRRHAPEFKSRLATEALRDRYSPQEMADMFGVHVSLIHAWRRQLRDSLPPLFGENPEEGKEGPDVHQLDQRIEELRAEQEWMRSVISRSIDMHERRDIVNPENEDLSIVRQTKLLGIHRSGLYYEKAHPRGKKQVQTEEPAPAQNADEEEKNHVSQ